ncbi:MAG TPA: RNA polymerase-associated protein RapA [Candidatus Binatia bacterium]|nr:RNA polymerase-associated protein RapA [Candidatus Binatia bacterium]
MSGVARGQRWMNEAEPELGLGVVVASDQRSASIHFAAAGETRRYVLRSAPLRRVAFSAGDSFVDDHGRTHQVEAVTERDGVLHYRTREGELCEERVSARIALTTPRERLLAGRVDPSRIFDLRRQTLARQHEHRRSPVRGFVGPRVDLLAHQFFVAAEVSARLAPRVLLADETGLGKTIEAGLCLSRLILNGRVARVLVLVPDSLLHQWLVELRRRFQLRFAIYDESRCAAIEESEPGANPFLEEQLVLAGLSLIADGGVRATQAAQAGWDMVVVDEAHHLQWCLSEASAAYRAVEAVTARAAAVLLLTATPQQLGEEGHFGRLRLLDPDRYADYRRWTEEFRRYSEVAALAGDLIAGNEPGPSAISALAGFLGVSDEEVVRRAREPGLRNQLLQDLIDRHGPGRVMFRNTRAGVGGFPVRQILRSELPLAEAELARRLHDELRGDLAPASAPDSVVDLGSDPRIAWLLSLLASPEPRKLLVICRSADKAEAIDAAIAARMRVSTALFHERLTLVQRDRNAAWFAQPDGARLLVCSELGSEGRNFQHAQHLVFFDVPLDPDLVEQRIGRLDRIGQQGVVHVHVPCVAGTGQEVLADWIDEGVDAFRRPTLVAQPLLQAFGDRVRELALSARDLAPSKLRTQIDVLVGQTQAQAAALVERVEKGRDRLLEMASLRREIAEPLLNEVRRMDADLGLEEWTLRVLEHFRIYAEEIAPRSYLLNPDALHSPDFPSLERGDTALTFDRSTALVREDLQFASADHPLIGDALELLLGSEAGNASFALLEEDGRPHLYLESIFVLEAVAPRRLHIGRFLAPTPVRVIVDQHEAVPDAEDDPCVAPAGSTGAPSRLVDGSGDWIRAQKSILAPLIARLYGRCEQLAAQRADAERAAARRLMQTQLAMEIERLKALAAVNDEVRTEEIAVLAAQRAELEAAIDSARVRPDALRLVWRGPVRDGAPLLSR